MTFSRPDTEKFSAASDEEFPQSVRRVLTAARDEKAVWIGPDKATKLTDEQAEAYESAHTILKYLAIEAPRVHKSGHPGGPLSAFTFCYGLLRRRNPHVDEPLRLSAGHLSILAYGLQYLGGRAKNDPRLSSPQAIIDSFRTVDGLPGHAEAGIGDIPFGFGPLGKGVSNAVGCALGRKMQKREGVVDVLIGDGEAQEGQIMEAARLASHLELSNLMVHCDMNDIQLSDMPTRVASADLSKFFHAAGWSVVEVQNGNDPAQVEAALDSAEELRKEGRPIFLCYYTTMGHGVSVMEEAANKGSAAFHGAPVKDEDAQKELAKLPSLDEVVRTYEPHRQKLAEAYNGAPAASEVLSAPKVGERTIIAEKGAARKEFGGLHIKNMMAEDPRIIVLHGDLAGSGGFGAVEKEFPDRIINCGAAEANMYMMAAGLRQAGMLPVTYTFAAFGTNEARANARLIDINSGHIPCSVLHDCTHAGLSVGEDGETHQERNYLNIPLDRTQVWSTADSNQAAAMAERAMELVAEGKESVYVFMPRDGHPQLTSPDGNVLYDKDYVFDGKINLVRGTDDTSDQATILSTGICIHSAVEAARILAEAEQSVQVRVLNVGCIRPIDASTIVKAALETMHLIVVEDHHSEGGLATQVADVIADFGLPCSLRRLGVNHYFPSGPAKDLSFLAGIDEESIADAVMDEVRREVVGGEEAFVTTVYALHEAMNTSRFAPSMKEFVSMLGNKNYLDALRESWAKRACSPDSLPSNEDLISRLSELGRL